MKLKTTVCMLTLVGYINTISAQDTWRNKIKRTACITTKKAIPNIGATIIPASIILFAQKYLGMTYKVNTKNDKINN